MIHADPMERCLRHATTSSHTNDKAAEFYTMHLNLSRELDDRAMEEIAMNNLEFLRN